MKREVNIEKLEMAAARLASLAIMYGFTVNITFSPLVSIPREMPDMSKYIEHCVQMLDDLKEKSGQTEEKE